MRHVLPVIAVALGSVAAAPSAHGLTLARADLEGTNGYEVRIDAIAGSVTIAAKDDGAGASYTADGTVRRERLQADLGRFGSVDLEFEARPGGECRGPFKVRRGHWVGAVRFVAETGFTSAAASTVPGRTLRPSRSCVLRRKEGNSPDAEFLLASSRDAELGLATFVSVARVSGRKASIFASQTRREAGIEISNFATDRLGRSRFRFSRERRRAAVRPHSPFSGRAEAHGHEWRGDLSVTMPATGTVPLTGPGFRARFETIDLP
jgi:hypothetical protein